MAKTQRRQRKRNATKRRRRTGGFHKKNMGTYEEYVFEKDELDRAYAEYKRLEEEHKAKLPSSFLSLENPEKYKKLQFDWYQSRPNLNNVIENIFPEITDTKEKGVAVYALKTAFLQDGRFSYGTA